MRIGQFTCRETDAAFASSLFLLLLIASLAGAQQYPEQFYQDLHWRMIGPFRGGRTRAVAGIAGQPNVFYVGAVDGGVWKIDDYGRTWHPIFDDQPTQSIGAIGVSPSNPGHCLRRQRRRIAAAGSVGRRWHL